MTARNPSLSLTYLISFLLALHLGLPLYINSSLLASVVDEKYVGFIFTASSLIILIALGYFRHILEHLGNFLSLQWIMIAELLALGTFLYTANPFAVTAAMIVHMVVGSLIAFSMDIFLEDKSINKKIGAIRGKYLTALSLGTFASPFIVGLLLKDGDYWKVYTLSILILAVIFLMFVRMYAGFRDPKYEKINFWGAWREIRKHRNVLKICYTNFLLYLFYAIMVVYTPLYLSSHLGFSWSTIGEIFTIMLLPFLFLEFPLGWIADKKIGEKEMLTAGFVITAFTTAVLTFITSVNPLVWGLALFSTRIGASMIEVMNETYFFKKTNDTDTPMLMFFRMTRPVGFIIGPTLATLTFIFFDFRHIFLITGILLLSGIFVALLIKDTK